MFWWYSIRWWDVVVWDTIIAFLILGSDAGIRRAASQVAAIRVHHAVGTVHNASGAESVTAANNPGQMHVAVARRCISAKLSIALGGGVVIGQAGRGR